MKDYTFSAAIAHSIPDFPQDIGGDKGDLSEITTNEGMLFGIFSTSNRFIETDKELKNAIEVIMYEWDSNVNKAIASFEVQNVIQL